MMCFHVFIYSMFALAMPQDRSLAERMLTTVNQVLEQEGYYGGDKALLQ